MGMGRGVREESQLYEKVSFFLSMDVARKNNGRSSQTTRFLTSPPPENALPPVRHVIFLTFESDVRLMRPVPKVERAGVNRVIWTISFGESFGTIRYELSTV